MAGQSLNKVLPDFPEIEVERVEYSAEPERFRDAGVKRFPTLLAGEQRLDGFLLTKRKIRRFLASL